jgi:peptidoglycan/xylan/chitin deacetylase (PgdA/CDA1 family)
VNVGSASTAQASDPIRVQGDETGGFQWPNDASVAVALSFDVDAEVGFLGEGREYERRLSTLSEGRFGVTRGIPRILELLELHRLPATFFVPGRTAELHPQLVRELIAAGHEVGHHGHMHLRSDRLTADEQREEIERGIDALCAAGAPRPIGYRSPSWEITPESFALLVEHGFLYDSSCMGDDRPYTESCGPDHILELPVHWSLDDWPHFGWSLDRGGNVASPTGMLECWRSEYRAARAEGRMVTFTMHPEVIGRAYRLEQLELLVTEMTSEADVWFTCLGGVARLLGGEPADS